MEEKPMDIEQSGTPAEMPDRRNNGMPQEIRNPGNNGGSAEVPDPRNSVIPVAARIAPGAGAEERIAAAVACMRARTPQIEVREYEPMSAHCSFKIGGPVRALASPADAKEACDAFRILNAYGLRPYLLGNGTNVVFPDEGNAELFVLSTEKMQALRAEENGRIWAEAGVPLARLANCALEQGLTGLEFASGIPGTVGGGALMNAGAYGGELKDAVSEVYVLWPETGETECIPGSDCAFGYRTSIFQHRSGIILRAAFRLTQGNREEIAAKMKDLNARRRDRQPLTLPSAGSAFRRPAGYFAAALIEECGLKGTAVGGAQVSEKHAGFIVNRGGATQKDLRQLMQLVQQTVYERKGVELKAEIILVDGTLSSFTAPDAEIPASLRRM